MAMLAAITNISKERGIMHQCSVEESMACGIGVCMTCVLPVEGEDGVVRMTRTCIDGPVMDGSKVTWTKSREVPDGVWGK
jgi:dihydroorotate dehydrogenase electron transfer subunit